MPSNNGSSKPKRHKRTLKRKTTVKNKGKRK